MAEYRKYSIKQNRFKRSFLFGLEIESEHVLKCVPDVPHRIFICDGIDGIEEGAKWGRFHLDYQLDEDMVVTTYAIALDEKEIFWEKGYVDLNTILANTLITNN